MLRHRVYDQVKLQSVSACHPWRVCILHRENGHIDRFSGTRGEGNDQKNQFVILACDGVWDLNTESDFQQLIMFCNDSEMLCSTIIKNTLRKDAWDNLSVFAIKLT